MPLVHPFNQAVTALFCFLLFISTKQQSSNPINAVVDDCDTGPYHKLFQSPTGSSIRINDLVENPDGTLVIIGRVDDNIANADALVMKTDAQGKPVWTRAYDSEISDEWLRISKIANGTYIIAGQSGSDITLMQIDDAGSIAWTKRISDNTMFLYDMLVDSDGSILLSGNRFDAQDESSAFLIKLDGQGNQQWSFLYDNPGNDLFLEIAQDAGGYYVTATCAAAARNGIVVKLNRSDGSIIWANQYDIQNRFDQFQQLHIVNNRILVNGYSRPTTPPAFNRQINLTLQSDGSIASMRAFSNNTFATNILPNADGSYILAQSNNQSDAFINVYKFDAGNQLLWGRKKFVDVNRGFPLLRNSTTNGLLIASTQKYSSSGAAYLIHTNANGIVEGCADENATEAISTLNVTMTPFQFANVSPQALSIVAENMNVNDEEINTSDYCKDDCSIISVEGDTSVCIGESNAVYKIIRNPGCTRPVTWSVTQDMARIVKETDSTIEVEFLDVGSVDITATMPTNCSVLTSQLKVSTNVRLGNVNLSRDHFLCQGDFVTISIPGYRDYLWSNGSTERFIRLTEPGTFHVTVTDYCGYQSSDTLEVHNVNPDEVDLGPDKAVCPHKPVDLDAGPGFKTYLWENGSTSQKIRVNTPGNYTVTVSNEHNCKASDTITLFEEGCYQGIVFPNAFTPNNDGKNDLFKPSVFATPEYFELIIFNRWGQVIFETKDFNTGWDGKISGHLQNSQNFLYICRYKFPSQEPQIQRSAFMLIQ